MYGGLRGRACSARGGSRCRKGVGGRVGNFYFFILPVQCLTPLFAPFVSVETVAAAAAAAAGPAPSRRALSSQQGALRVAVAPAEARRVRCGSF